MIKRDCNLRAGVYKVQTFGTTHDPPRTLSIKYILWMAVMRRIMYHLSEMAVYGRFALCG